MHCQHQLWIHFYYHDINKVYRVSKIYKIAESAYVIFPQVSLFDDGESLLIGEFQSGNIVSF